MHVPMLLAATVAVIGGFALFNEGLYQTVGRGWYHISDSSKQPIYADFLAYSLTKILGLMDVLDLASSHHILGHPFVRQAAWPASALLVGFKLFFTLVLLHQIVASLSEASCSHKQSPISGARTSRSIAGAEPHLPVYGMIAIGPLFALLRSITTLTKEQRDQLPLILANIGPSIIPRVRHLHDSHEFVRSTVVGACRHSASTSWCPHWRLPALTPATSSERAFSNRSDCSSVRSRERIARSTGADHSSWMYRSGLAYGEKGTAAGTRAG